MDFFRKILKSLIIGILAGIGIALITNFFVSDLIDRLEHQSYYMRYFWKYMELKNTSRDDNQSDAGICIVDIDDRTMHKLGSYWNWNRSYHAEMIDSLSKHFPAAIVMDVHFYDPEDQNEKDRIDSLLAKSRRMNPDAALSDNLRRTIINTIDYDEQFIDAVSRSGRVFNGIRMSDARDYPSLSQVKHLSTMEWHNSLCPESAIKLNPEKRARVYHVKEYVDGIFPRLAQASRGIGYLNIQPNSDGVIRDVPLIYAFGANPVAYFPVSLRTVISLFATPAEEINFLPGKYLDIGKPFKIFNDKTAGLSFSYPGVSALQVKAIVAKAREITALEPGKSLTVSAFCAIGVSAEGRRSISMFAGTIPHEAVLALASADLKALPELALGGSFTLAPQITITRESESDWVLRAPYGDEEYYLTRDEMETLAMLDHSLFEKVKPGKTELVFHAFTVTNKTGKLISSIPVLQGQTIVDLCNKTWKQIEEIPAGQRLDFGKPVRIPLLKDNRHIVTYFGPRGRPFKYYSYYDIMKGLVQGSLEGRIFVVGSTVSNMFDIVSVPLGNVYPGVEVHASLMNSFITGTFVNSLTAWQEFLILLLTGILIGFISYMLKPLPGAILTLAGVFGYFLLAMTVFGAQNLWIPMARPVLTILLTYTVVMVYRYATEEKDRKFLQSTFKAYLSPELIDIMYKSKQTPRLGGEEGVRTAYFTDIQGFSTFSEKLGSPTRLVELLNEYLTAMTDTLLEHFGTLDKYEGDAIIAFFGAPMPIPDHAYQACLTALSMQEKLNDLRTKWTSEGEKWPAIVHNMRMRIGINTGAITTGNMGSRVRMNYTMMGDAVNLAARLESAAKQYGVYTMISHATREIVKDRFETRQIDKIQVVGKSEPVVVYELICEKGRLDEKIAEMIEIYNRGLECFYNRDWDRAIELMGKSHELEPFRLIAPKGNTPSKIITEYAITCKNNPPGLQWNGVTQLTSK